MDKKKCLAAIDDYMLAANNLAIKLVEWEARKILREHHLNEFVMAMGSAFFTNRLYQPIPRGQLKYLKSFEDMIDYLDDRFNIKGIPMRFTASGKRVSNW